MTEEEICTPIDIAQTHPYTVQPDSEYEVTGSTFTFDSDNHFIDYDFNPDEIKVLEVAFSTDNIESVEVVYRAKDGSVLNTVTKEFIDDLVRLLWFLLVGFV